MDRLETLRKDERAYAVVEAAILFPIILMIFAALCLLAVYLPARSSLQRAAQYAANVMATISSDTWIRYDSNNMEYIWLESRNDVGMRNVYMDLFQGLVNNLRSDCRNVEKIVRDSEEKGISTRAGELTVDYKVSNFIVYKEMHVTATRTISTPVDLSFIGFPKEISITVTASSMVPNGDEFVRNMDLARDFTMYLAEKYEMQDFFESLGKLGDQFKAVFGVGGEGQK